MSENKSKNEKIENTENEAAETETAESEMTENIEKLETPGSPDGAEDAGAVEPAESGSDALQAKKKAGFSFNRFRDSAAGTTAILGAVALIAALVLSAVNSFAAPVIEKRLADEKAAAVARFFGEGTYAETVTDIEIPANVNVNEALIVRNSETSALEGYCVTVAPKGFNGGITMLVAINPNGAVRDTFILDENESWKGPDIRKDEFRDQFKNKTKGIKIGDINAIAGATVSSKAFLSGVNAALDIVSEITGE